MLFSPFPARAPARGFTLVELLVSMTIGLVILLGMVMMFVSNTKSQAELEKSNRQTESGRYAIQVLSDDIFNAGFYSEFDPTPMPDPASLPGPCDATLATMRAALPLAVQGLDQSATSAPCLTDAKANSDVLVVRRTETCLPGVGNCEAESTGGAFFQASKCSSSSELGAGDTNEHFRLDTAIANLNRHNRDCIAPGANTLADKRRFVTHIYYVATSHMPSDGIPTLKRATLNTAGTDFTVEAVAEGIEFLHFEYGLDTNNDGAPDSYTPAPGSVAMWRNAVAIKVHVLSRNTDSTRGYTDKKEYTMGLNAAGQANKPTITDKQFKRHLFSTMVFIPNSAGRKTP